MAAIDEHVCTKCKVSAMGSDGICGSCGWDKYLAEYAEKDISEEESEEDEDEERDTVSLEELEEDFYIENYND